MDPPLWITIVSTLGGGTIVSTFLAWYINEQTKKRDQFFEMSKHKMDVIAKSMSTYTRLGSYYDEFSGTLQSSSPNYQRAFFCASTIIYLESTIFESVGTIQLDCLDAELIITSFELELDLDPLTKDKIRDLAKNHPTYKEFFENMDNELFQKFKERFLWHQAIPASTTQPNLRQRCRWYCQLMFLEINEVYSIWYNQHPIEYFTTLDNDLKTYLNNKYPGYYNKMKKWPMKSKLKL